MDDDLGLQQGDYYTAPQPKEQSYEEFETRAKVKAAKPFFEDILRHFTDRIKFYDSIDSIQVDIDEDPEIFQKVHAANKLVKQSLINEKEMIEGLIDTFK